MEALFLWRAEYRPEPCMCLAACSISTPEFLRLWYWTTRTLPKGRKKQSGRENKSRFICSLFASAESVACGTETQTITSKTILISCVSGKWDFVTAVVVSLRLVCVCGRETKCVFIVQHASALSNRSQRRVVCPDTTHFLSPTIPFKWN